MESSKSKRFAKITIGSLVIIFFIIGVLWLVFRDTVPPVETVPPPPSPAVRPAIPGSELPPPPSGPGSKRKELEEYVKKWAERGDSTDIVKLTEELDQLEEGENPEAEAQILFDLSDWYLRGALWEWTERSLESRPDLEAIKKSLDALDEVIRRYPGTEYAASAQLKRARVYHNGMSGIWDRQHLEEAKWELTVLLGKYPASRASREGREMLREIKSRMRTVHD